MVDLTKDKSLWEIDGTETQLKTPDAIDMQSNKIINLTNPTDNQDAATRKYVNDEVSVFSMEGAESVIPSADADTVTTIGDISGKYNWFVVKFWGDRGGENPAEVSLRLNADAGAGRYKWVDNKSGVVTSSTSDTRMQLCPSMNVDEECYYEIMISNLSGRKHFVTGTGYNFDTNSISHFGGSYNQTGEITSITIIYESMTTNSRMSVYGIKAV